jgi:hypothetical protein
MIVVVVVVVVVSEVHFGFPFRFSTYTPLLMKSLGMDCWNKLIV